MVPSIGEEQARIAAAASSGSWANLNAALMADGRNDLVSIVWDVVYDKVGHDPSLGLPLLSRFAPSQRLVAFRQTFIQRCHSRSCITRRAPLRPTWRST